MHNIANEDIKRLVDNVKEYQLFFILKFRKISLLFYKIIGFRKCITELPSVS